MTRTSGMRSRAVVRAVALAAIAILAASACSGSSPAPERLAGGRATFAEAPNARPNYIFPLTNGSFFSFANVSEFQFLMFRPLYWFGGSGTVKLNPSLSLAQLPHYSADGKTVTIKLKGWKWSDGTPITSRDIEFWQNMVTANKSNWAAYSPRGYPDNIVKAQYPDSSTAVFTLDKQYGSNFFTNNELSQLIPMPQHVWDKVADNSSVGDYDRDPATARQVYTYLDVQARSVETYDRNPLWQVVDGPWKLKHMTADGGVVMIPNTVYSGPVKPTLTEFDEAPYTSDTSEFDTIRSGGIDYGYMPTQNLGTVHGLQDPNPSGAAALKKYAFAPWIGWQIVYIQENFANADHGAIYKQLYFRQAMQHLVDQDGYIKNIFKGYAYPTYGPIPILPKNDFADALVQKNPYPFDVNAAAELLKGNGWTVSPGGTSICTNPGSGSGQCGAGVVQGAKAALKLEYASGTPSLKLEMEALKSDFSKAGIEVDLSEAPFDTVIGDSFGGTTTADLDNWGGGWIFAPDYYPTGDEFFLTDAGANGGGYSDPTNDANIVATLGSDDVKALQAYQDYLARQLPVIWVPTADSQLSLVNRKMHGWDPQDPLMQIYPEDWYFTS